MKSNPLAGLLVVLAVLCSLYTVWLASIYSYSSNKAALLNYQLNTMEVLRLNVQGLANDALQYSKLHPSIDPVLQKFDIKAVTTNAAPATSQPQPK